MNKDVFLLCLFWFLTSGGYCRVRVAGEARRPRVESMSCAGVFRRFNLAINVLSRAVVVVVVDVLVADQYPSSYSSSVTTRALLDLSFL